MAKPPSVAAKNYEDPDFAAIIAKPISALQEHFAEWVIEKTDMTFATKKEESSFREGLRIGTALRGYHQASPENQERLADALEARKAAQVEAAAEKPAKSAPAAVAPATPAKKAAKKTAPAAEAAPPAKSAPAKRAPAKRTGTRAATTAAPAEDEAPF